jgi:hypothetical protein
MRQRWEKLREKLEENVGQHDVQPWMHLNGESLEHPFDNTDKF